ncbi:MAG TPA: response regulator [Cyclobacteriaceae bacterium]|nr:response regulator [Cyclobacteriaceae bacterium]
MKAFFLSLLFFILTGSVIAQSKPDSLKAVIARTQGIEKATALMNLAKYYFASRIDTAKQLYEEALTISRGLKNDTTTVKILCSYGHRLAAYGEIDLGKKQLSTALEMASHTVLPPKFVGEIYMQLYNVQYWQLSNYDSCIYYIQKYIDVVDDSTSWANGYIELGVSYSEQGNNAKALEHYTTADSYLQSPNADMWTVAHLNNVMGMLYSDEHEYKQAEGHFLKALEYSKQSTYPGAELPELNNLGVLYDWMGEYEKSLQYLEMARKVLNTRDDPWSVANNSLNTGDALTHSGNHAAGIEKYMDALAGFSKIKEDYKVAAVRVQLAGAYRLTKRYRDAEREALLAFEWDKKNGYGDLVKTSSQELYKIYGETRQFEKAYRYQSRYLEIIDSLNSIDRKKKIGVMEKNFEIAKQERVRERLERENELHLAKAETDRITRTGLITATVFLAIAAAVSLISYRRIKSQKQKIEEQAQQLQEASKAKSRFFANVSHELRTPLTILNGMLELMQENPTQNGSSEKMAIALGNSRRLQGMINEVLDLSRLEGGKWELSKKPKEIQPLLNRIVLAFESLIVKKNLKLEYEASALNGLVIDIDEDKFEKVVNNLVYNAIKFNHEGGSIKVTGSRTDRMMVLQVTDTGTGIPESDLPHIFDRFYQSASTDQLNSHGIGIGLALVREFTELHGGDVNVTSRVNEGSSFTVQFPIRTSGNGHPEPADEDAPEPEVSFEKFSRKPLVLVVEDNDEMRFYLKEILGEYADIAETRHGREGLKWLKSNMPDLIISDVMMPEMDGYEFLSQLKKNDTYRGIPVVMLTARASEEDLLHGLSLGVDDYIIKPFNAKELKIRIHNLLTNQEIRKEWIKKPAEPEEILPPASPTEDQLFLQKVQTYVETHAENSSLGIGDLADHLAMSERQVYRRAATLTGMTPGQLIKDIKLKIAYRLLLERKVSKVAELAKRVGFENSSYFSKQFLERYGKRPTDFL